MKPWHPKTFVKVNLGERLAGEPAKPPLEGRALDIIVPVLGALGANSSARNSPIELRYYAVDTLGSP